MKIIDYKIQDDRAFSIIKLWANAGLFDGRSESKYMLDCRWFLEKYGCIVIFTRDIGHHSGGWWKNPDYERCYHLSISFPEGRNKRHLNKVIDGLFGWTKRFLWIEPPYSKEGKSAEVWHYRLFCDAGWQPIKPRGEVYSKEFTEIGWKSFSELNFNI
jgi:hypothetical protein